MIKIMNYKELNNGYLKGTFNIKVQKWGNVVINGLSYFEKNNSSWITFPSKSYEKDGQVKYFSFIKFEDPEMEKKFKEKVTEELKRHRSKPCLTNFTEKDLMLF